MSPVWDSGVATTADARGPPERRRLPDVRVKLKEFVCAVGLGVNGRAVPTQDCGPKCRGYLRSKRRPAFPRPGRGSRRRGPDVRRAQPLARRSRQAVQPEHHRRRRRLPVLRPQRLARQRPLHRPDGPHFQPVGPPARLDSGTRKRTTAGKTRGYFATAAGSMSRLSASSAATGFATRRNCSRGCRPTACASRTCSTPRFPAGTSGRKTTSISSTAITCTRSTPSRRTRFCTSRATGRRGRMTRRPPHRGTAARCAAGRRRSSSAMSSGVSFMTGSNATGIASIVRDSTRSSAQPPFRVSRIIPEPILSADPATKPHDQYASVVWPGGAVLRDGVWTLACGIHDRTTAFYQFSHRGLEDRLVRVGPPGWWAHHRTLGRPGHLASCRRAGRIPARRHGPDRRRGD
jgi:hypothetical protein